MIKGINRLSDTWVNIKWPNIGIINLRMIELREGIRKKHMKKIIDNFPTLTNCENADQTNLSHSRKDRQENSTIQ